MPTPRRLFSLDRAIVIADRIAAVLEKPPMPPWLDRLLGRKDGADPESLLAQKREAQELRLQLEERSRQLTALQKERERQQDGEEARVTEAVQARVERLL